MLLYVLLCCYCCQMNFRTGTTKLCCILLDVVFSCFVRYQLLFLLLPEDVFDNEISMFLIFLFCFGGRKGYMLTFKASSIGLFHSVTTGYLFKRLCVIFAPRPFVAVQMAFGCSQEVAVFPKNFDQHWTQRDG